MSRWTHLNNLLSSDTAKVKITKHICNYSTQLKWPLIIDDYQLIGTSEIYSYNKENEGQVLSASSQLRKLQDVVKFTHIYGELMCQIYVIQNI